MRSSYLLTAQTLKRQQSATSWTLLRDVKFTGSDFVAQEVKFLDSSAINLMNLRSNFKCHGMIVSMVCSRDLFYVLLLNLRNTVPMLTIEMDCMSSVDGHLVMGMLRM